MVESRQRNCVNEIDFYREIQELKGQLKTKRLTKKLLFRRLFLQQGQTFLERKTVRQLCLSGNTDRSKSKQLTKRELFQVLSAKHTVEVLTANSKLRKVASRNAELSQIVVNTSIPCPENAQQLMAAPTFLFLLEIDLM